MLSIGIAIFKVLRKYLYYNNFIIYTLFKKNKKTRQTNAKLSKKKIILE